MMYMIKKYTLTKIKNKKSGFTLIELLVVIAIIGVLASVVLASVSSARANARNSVRISEVKQLMTSLELYRNQNGGYPCSNGSYTSVAQFNCDSSVDGGNGGAITVKGISASHDLTVNQLFRTAINFNLTADNFNGANNSISYRVAGRAGSGANATFANRNGYVIHVVLEDVPACVVKVGDGFLVNPWNGRPACNFVQGW